MTEFTLNQPVIYRGKTYTFPGTVCGITDDGQIIVRAIGTPEGFYAGMKHIFGPSQLEPWEGTATPAPADHVVGMTREQQIVAMSKVLDECRWFKAPDTGMEVKSLVWATRLWEAANPDGAAATPETKP